MPTRGVNYPTQLETSLAQPEKKCGNVKLKKSKEQSSAQLIHGLLLQRYIVVRKDTFLRNNPLKCNGFLFIICGYQRFFFRLIVHGMFDSGGLHLRNNSRLYMTVCSLAQITQGMQSLNQSLQRSPIGIMDFSSICLSMRIPPCLFSPKWFLNRHVRPRFVLFFVSFHSQQFGESN